MVFNSQRSDVLNENEITATYCFFPIAMVMKILPSGERSAVDKALK